MKSEKMWFRALPADKQALERLADIEGESMATVMRKLFREAARARGLLPQSNEHTNGAPWPEKRESAVCG